MTTFSTDVLEQARGVQLLILDVDGVLTDGRLFYNTSGVETKAFYAQDGAAIKMLQSVGIPVAIVTGRTSRIVEHRARELGITHVYQGVQDKADALAELTTSSRIAAHDMAHAGDDVADLALFRQVGFKVSVPSGHPVVLAAADYVTDNAAGLGAVREICQLIMQAKDLWNDAIRQALQ
ncbi:MAG: HAD hydrolase family protein [Gammaproteobacteria bacterium]|nr:HAD hydrolase family protein [Gammaproteobacteria bacterium]